MTNLNKVKNRIFCIALPAVLLMSCNNQPETMKENTKATEGTTTFENGHADVNGIKMYYEIHGSGEPLVLLHGGGSTIETSFGLIIPGLAKKFKVIEVELQNHGRSGFRDVPQTFEQGADDVAALLEGMGIKKASFLGFSNGGTTAMQMAIRHPQLVHKLILASATFKRDGLVPGFFEGMGQVKLEHMPQQLKDAFLKLNPDTAKLQAMFEKDRDRMISFTDMDSQKIKTIAAPTLVISADADVVVPEHAVELYRLVPNCRLAIVPGIHGSYIGEITTREEYWQETTFVVAMIEKFLAEEGDKVM